MAMETQNLTVRIPKVLLSKAKQVAAEHGTTVTALVIEGLTRATSGNEAYEAAWARQREQMQKARPLRKTAETFTSRDSLHERS